MSNVRRVEKNGVLFLAIDRERLVDDIALQDVQHEILEIIEAGDDRPVVDLSRVHFMSSAAIGMLVRFRKRRGERGLSLKLCGVNPPVEETLRICGLLPLFEVYETPEDVIASFENR